MNINIRQSNKEDDFIIVIPINANVQEVQNKIQQVLKVEANQQRLYYGGKQLIDDCKLADYNIRNLDTILLSIISKQNGCFQSDDNDDSKDKKLSRLPAQSQFYQIGDLIDAMVFGSGWFEARIVGIFIATKCPETNTNENDLLFSVKMDRNEDNAAIVLKFDEIRPRAFFTYPRNQLVAGMMVLANYNMDKPREWGYWNDFIISQVSQHHIKGTIVLGTGDTKENCIIRYPRDYHIMKIEVPSREHSKIDYSAVPLREIKLYCNRCRDDSRKKCRSCSCNICGLKTDINRIIICEECQKAFHIFCLTPRLTEIPADEWYCFNCKTNDLEIVKPGEKPFKNQYLGNPMVPVGTCWETRTQVSKAGIHRPLKSRIDFTASGVESILLDALCTPDEDRGEEFYLTYVPQEDINSPQSISALRRSCDGCRSSKIQFGIANNWRKGKAIRVVRSHGWCPNSTIAPKQGHRYDGIYKVEEFFPEVRLLPPSLSHPSERLRQVWRFLLKRDDPTPPPWACEAKKYDMILDKYTKPISTTQLSCPQIATHVPTMSQKIRNLMKSDKENELFWSENMENSNFFENIRGTFMCSICLKILRQPVKMECQHFTCKICLNEWFNKSDKRQKTCPKCRFRVEKQFKMSVNENLDKILQYFFPEMKT